MVEGSLKHSPMRSHFHPLLLFELLPPTFPSTDAQLPPFDLPSASIYLSNTHSPSIILQMILDSLSSFLYMLELKHGPLQHRTLTENTRTHSFIYFMPDELVDHCRLSLLHIGDTVDDNFVLTNHILVTVTDTVLLHFASVPPNESVVIVPPNDYVLLLFQPHNPIEAYLIYHYSQCSDFQEDVPHVSNHQRESKGYFSVQLYLKAVVGEIRQNRYSCARHIPHENTLFRAIPALDDNEATLASLQDGKSEPVVLR